MKSAAEAIHIKPAQVKTADEKLAGTSLRTLGRHKPLNDREVVNRENESENRSQQGESLEEKREAIHHIESRVLHGGRVAFNEETQNENAKQTKNGPVRQGDFIGFEAKGFRHEQEDAQTDDTDFQGDGRDHGRSKAGVTRFTRICGKNPKNSMMASRMTMAA